MCGRFTLHTPESQVREIFHVGNSLPLGLKPRYNIAPSQDIPIIRDTATSREMVFARWELIPHWSKESKTKYSTINARIESVAEKPTYSAPFRQSRCLIPADGFYEWKVIDDVKVPYYMRMRKGDVFAFAGICDQWQGEGEIINSCSIIVMQANETMQPVHDHMPAVIAPVHYDLWLDMRVNEKTEIMSLLNSAPSKGLTFYPVSSWVNAPKHEDERCIQTV